MYCEGHETLDRVRMSLSANSKGQMQIDCTAESSSVERSADLLSRAISECKKICDEQGLLLAR